MGLLDGLEKLINEHGSAVILKERIELANDKYAALESKVSNLEAENKTLRLDLEKAQDEIQNLKKLTEKAHIDRLDEIKEKILQFLIQHDEVNSHQISQALGASEQVITFHLDELEISNFVSPSYIINSPVLWSIAHEGRRYLIINGLLA